MIILDALGASWTTEDRSQEMRHTLRVFDGNIDRGAAKASKHEVLPLGDRDTSYLGGSQRERVRGDVRKGWGARKHGFQKYISFLKKSTFCKKNCEEVRRVRCVSPVSQPQIQKKRNNASAPSEKNRGHFITLICCPFRIPYVILVMVVLANGAQLSQETAKKKENLSLNKKIGKSLGSKFTEKKHFWFF